MVVKPNVLETLVRAHSLCQHFKLGLNVVLRAEYIAVFVITIAARSKVERWLDPMCITGVNKFLCKIPALEWGLCDGVIGVLAGEQAEAS
jgi:hypothetical protein